MAISMDAANALESAIDRKIEQAAAKRTRAYGEVSRIEADGTVYVMLDGADTDTPISGNAAAVKEGERVSVTVDGGSMVIDGNYSAPATDDTAAKAAQATADAAVQSADVAAAAAAQAVESAAVAGEAAAEAQNSLMSVVQGATTVEKAVSVMQTALEAVVDYDPQNDVVTEYFWHDANGAHVLGDTSGYRNDIDSTGMSIVEVSSEDEVAHFGADGAQIGVDSKLVLTDKTETFDDSYGNTLFSIVADGAKESDANGESFLCDGTKKEFYLQLAIACEIESVDLDGVEITDYIRDGQLIKLSSPPAAGSHLYVLYSPYRTTSKIAYTFGVRNGAEPVGAFSVCEGQNCAASGLDSHARGARTIASGRNSSAEGYLSTASGEMSHSEGSNCTASGIASHAEGGFYDNTYGGNTASGKSSHAEGYGCIASGDMSHAQNKGTKASSDNQTALGKYNVEDANGDYAVIVGNGTSNSNRSDALTVDWNGNVGIAGDVQDMSGNQLYADATHTHTESDITDLGSYAPSVHTHAASDITSGTLGVARGGTGITNAGHFDGGATGVNISLAANTWTSTSRSVSVPAKTAGLLFGRVCFTGNASNSSVFRHYLTDTSSASSVNPDVDASLSALGYTPFWSGTGSHYFTNYVVAPVNNTGSTAKTYYQYVYSGVAVTVRNYQFYFIPLGASF